MDLIQQALHDATTDELLIELLGRHTNAIFIGEVIKGDGTSNKKHAKLGQLMACKGLASLMSDMIGHDSIQESNNRNLIQNRRHEREERLRCQKESHPSIGDDKPTESSQQGSSSELPLWGTTGEAPPKPRL